MTFPGLSGLELQQQPAERTDMPIIFITGHGDVPMTVQAMKAGAVEFLSKPFTNDVLLDAVGRVGLEAISLQPPVQLRPRQSEATRSFRFIPIGLVQDALDHALFDGAQISRRWQRLHLRPKRQVPAFDREPHTHKRQPVPRRTGRFPQQILDPG